MRVSNKKLNPSLENQITHSLAQAISDINTTDKARTFISDFLTKSEQNTFAKRLAIAYWLKKGRSYENIKQNLKVSSATIASVQEMMKAPGFEKALEILEADEWANQWSSRIKKFVR